MQATNPQSFSPLLGDTDRDTMGNVYDVLAFVGNLTQTQVESATASCHQTALTPDGLHGLSLICQMLSHTLAHEPAQSPSGKLHILTFPPDRYH